MSSSSKTVREILTAGSRYLADKGVPSPETAVKLLLSRLLRCSLTDLNLRHDEILPERYIAAMRRGIRRVGAGEPVQYVTGETAFMGHVFAVDPRALIPRPETEGLVERILADQDAWSRESSPHILDIGTGSGCIAISLALAKKNAKILAMDISKDAIELARENAERLGAANVEFYAGDLANVLDPQSMDLVVSNPPYIPTAEWEKLPPMIRNHEPRKALDGGPDGLDVIRQVAQDAVILLKPGGRLYLEIGETQAPAVRDLLDGEGFSEIFVSRDLNDRDRYVCAVMPHDEEEQHP